MRDPEGETLTSSKARPVTMAVARQARSPLVLESGEIEGPRPDEVLVRVVATGVCHTDMVVRDQDFAAPLPMVLGHEGAGVVEAVCSSPGAAAAGSLVLAQPAAKARAQTATAVII